ncbi:BadF/BadG/BcrA/BcrD ATPase family protein [Bowmanella yangjiangensis]|uniref:BadF/BadG/BcrA/BcrD ATPase family protein n=1 Tax=Bowmanella yangjiangensis TaxID=2811230 RepID=UPI002FCDC69B
MKTKNQQEQDLLFMGIDGGGSHCRVMIQNGQGMVLGQGQGGPANPVYGVQQCKDSIIKATRDALSEAELDDKAMAHLVVGGGLAGLHLPQMQAQMQAWQHPFAALYLTTDLHAAALGAHQGMDGGVIILGTGFSSLAACKGKLTQVGGYGFPINATCSGAWFGLEAVKAVLLDADGVGLSTSLTQALLETRSATELAEAFMHATATDYAKLAPLVFEQADVGDKVSLGLIQQGAAFINQVIRRLLACGVTRLAMIGGITERIKPWLDPQLVMTVGPALASPQQGAILFAQQSHKQKNKTKDPL